MLRRATPGHPMKRARMADMPGLMRWIERFVLAVGFVFLTIWLAAYVHRVLMVRVAMKNFEDARHQAAGNMPPTGEPRTVTKEEGPPVMKDGKASTADYAGAGSTAVNSRGEIPLAILRIPTIHLEAPVVRGTDDITLNRGVGQIAGTASPGEKGNIGLAGHRDSFFRNLKDVNRGDAIELQTITTSEIYIVDRILITGPDDVSVLQPRDAQSLTLITCYPFEFLGPAPRRFVVQASIKR